MFKKEGPKVLGYYTTKKCILGAVDGLIWTTSSQHLIIYIKVFKYILMKFIWRYLYLDRNLADMGYFRSTSTNLLYKMLTKANLILQSPYRGINGVNCFGMSEFCPFGQKNMDNSRENDQFNHKILFWSRFWLLNTFFLQIYP